MSDSVDYNSRPPVSDELLVASAQSGDVAAFGTLVERYEPRMFRYARKFLQGHEDIQDLVQEVFIKAYTNLQSFDTSRRFSPWLYRIAHNEFVNALKRRVRLPFTLGDIDTILPQLSYTPDTLGDIDRAALIASLHTSLGQLDPRYREPLILYYLEELSYREIADVLGVPVATVGVRLKRGRTALQNLCL